MGTKPDRPETCQRLERLRREIFGPRGRAAFARALGISPSTYNYYEKTRPPPADLLARAADVTGADAEWLLTGRGDPFPAAPSKDRDTELSQDLHGALARFSDRAGATPKGAAARVALERLLSEVRRTLPPAEDPWEPYLGAVKATCVPIIGRTAAGLLAQWEDFFAGHDESDTLDGFIGRLEGKAGRQRPADMQSADPGLPPEAPFGREARLIQLSEPTPDGCVEFVDLAGVQEVAPGTFGLRVDGDSMAPRILDGDIVISRRDALPEPGQTVIVRLQGRIGVTVKLWRPEGDRVHLIPVNEAYDPTVCRRDDVLWACRVLGVVRL